MKDELVIGFTPKKSFFIYMKSIIALYVSLISERISLEMGSLNCESKCMQVLLATGMNRPVFK